MNETLRLLYDKFYTPLPMVESEQEVETCHRQLIERLDSNALWTALSADSVWHGNWHMN